MSRRVWLATLGALSALLAVAAGASVLAARRALAPAAATAPEILFDVPRGASLGRIAGDLEERGLVRSSTAFRWLARLRDVENGLRAGQYRLAASMPPDEILAKLARGEVATWEVVVPEGFTAVQIAARLEALGIADAQAFGAFVFDPASAAALGVEGTSLEGYLFPETYRLPRGLSAREVALAFVSQFLGVWDELAPAAAAQGFSMHEVVTLASIVEKETGVPEERPLVAAVFRNRLARGMRLETDPTVIYGIADFDGNLRRRDLENPANPYNTYVIAGLPPGPIANPGEASLRAVLEPADADYLFFVSKNDGTHTFSRTLREHQIAVNRYQRGRGSR